MSIENSFACNHNARGYFFVSGSFIVLTKKRAYANIPPSSGSGCSSVGRALRCQRSRRRFESGHPLFSLWQRSQVVRQWSAKPLFTGSNPVVALAWVAELVDASDLKSGGNFLPCRFEPDPRHHPHSFFHCT